MAIVMVMVMVIMAKINYWFVFSWK